MLMMMMKVISFFLLSFSFKGEWINMCESVSQSFSQYIIQSSLWCNKCQGG